MGWLDGIKSWRQSRTAERQTHSNTDKQYDSNLVARARAVSHLRVEALRQKMTEIPSYRCLKRHALQAKIARWEKREADMLQVINDTKQFGVPRGNEVVRITKLAKIILKRDNRATLKENLKDADAQVGYKYGNFRTWWNLSSARKGELEAKLESAKKAAESVPKLKKEIKAAENTLSLITASHSKFDTSPQERVMPKDIGTLHVKIDKKEVKRAQARAAQMREIEDLERAITELP